MAGGFNTDVPCEGGTLHVQSEDRGPENPVVETLVYLGGQILHQERSAYAEPGVSAPPGEAERHVDQQHRDVVRRARHGEFGAQRPRLAERMQCPDLVEAVGAALESEPGWTRYDLEFIPAAPGSVTGRLVVREDSRPAARVVVRARLVAPGLTPADVWGGETGADGCVEVAAVPPALAGAVIFRADSAHGSGRLRYALSDVTSAQSEYKEDETRLVAADELEAVSAGAPVPVASPVPGSSS